jgi:hypothetical protein
VGNHQLMQMALDDLAAVASVYKAGNAVEQGGSSLALQRSMS